MKKIYFLLFTCILTVFACKKEPGSQTPDKNKADTNRWATILKNNPLNGVAISFSNKDTGFVVLFNDSTLKQSILATHDGGKTWVNNICNLRADSIFINNYSFQSVNNNLYCYNNQKLLKSINNGVDWTTIIQNNNIQSIFTYYYYYAIDDMHILLYRDTGLYLTTDGGVSWNNVFSWRLYSFMRIYQIMFISKFTGFFLARNNGIWPNNLFIGKTTNDGLTWDSLACSNQNLWKIQFITNKTGYGVGENNDNNNLFKTTDGGVTWIFVYHLNGIFPINDINFVNADTGYIRTEYNIYYTYNGGKSWKTDYTLFPQPDYKTLNAWSFTKTGEAYVLTNLGRIIKKMY